MIKRPRWMKKSIATYHPTLYKTALTFKQIERHIEMFLDKNKYANHFQEDNLKFRVKKHQSVLIKKLTNYEDIVLQHNKVDNLKIVVRKLNGIIIKPGETFSFCKLVGKPTLKKGFKHGMELSGGKAQAGIGGGICQASNLIYWLCLHSPLDIIERHHHSFDPFPDDNRVLPFASGATVMYNYRDLRFTNNTSHTFQIKLWLDKKCLNGDLRCSDRLQFSYTVYEKNHYFEKLDGNYYRSNELWRKVFDKYQSGKVVDDTFIVKNYAEVKYVPKDISLRILDI